MKRIIGILFLMAAMLFSACEEAEEITGDSSLKVINDCTYSVKIYFDDTFIGRVSSEESETWDVPSGQHQIEGKCSFADDYKGTHTFIAGSTTVIKLELTNKYDTKSITIIDQVGD